MSRREGMVLFVFFKVKMIIERREPDGRRADYEDRSP